MAAKKKIDGRTKEGRALMQKALAKAAKRGNAQAAKKLNKMSKAKKVAKKGAKKAGRPAIAAHRKIAKKFPAGEAVAVKSREGIVGVVAHYIDDDKRVVIRRGIENIAETQIIVPTVKLRAATSFEIETMLHSLHLLQGLHEHWVETAGKVAGKIEEAIESVQKNVAIDPDSDALKVVERAEDVKESNEAEALKIVEDVLKSAPSTDEVFPYSA